MFLNSRKSCSLLCCGRSLCPRAKPNTRPNVEWFWVKLFLLRELKQKALVYGGSKIICDYEWSFVQRNQMAAVNPQRWAEIQLPQHCRQGHCQIWPNATCRWIDVKSMIFLQMATRMRIRSRLAIGQTIFGSYHFLLCPQQNLFDLSYWSQIAISV